MNSSRLKWLLIIMFLAVNLFFLHEYKAYSESTGYYTEKELTSAVEVLSRHNTPIKASAIPKEKKTIPVLKLELDDNYREKAAKALMNASYTAFALPEGTGYSNSDETLMFFEGRRFKYAQVGFDGVDKEIEKKLDRVTDAKECEKYVSRLFEAFFPSAITDTQRMSLTLLGSYKKDEYVYVRVSQLIDGVEIDGNEVVAVYKENELVGAEGTLFFSTPISEFDSDMLDAINVLFKTQKTDNEIVLVDLMYFPVSTETGSFYLTPSYRLVHQNGDVHVWDATSGVQRY